MQSLGGIEQFHRTFIFKLGRGEKSRETLFFGRFAYDLFQQG
jgi:hypothetical protein